MEKTTPAPNIILQNPHPELRKVAKAVPTNDFGQARLQEIIARMSAALEREHDGVALAAPQIGVPLCLFIVSGRLGQSRAPKPDQVYINPKIIRQSRKKVWLEEGCLSVRYLYGQVARYEKVSLEAWDETGKRFVRHASGLLAQIFQHETDHLDGKLFIDLARKIHEQKPTESE